jgi:hypothetical protein
MGWTHCPRSINLLDANSVAFRSQHDAFPKGSATGAFVTRYIYKTPFSMNLFAILTYLTSPQTTHQVTILHSAVNRAVEAVNRKETINGIAPEERSPLSEAAVVVAFFGWELVPSASFSRASIRPSSVALPSLPSSAMGNFHASPAQNRALVACQLCQRQVGLWTFTSAVNGHSSTPNSPSPSFSFSGPSLSRQFDVLKEHRPHCPFVVKSTYLPTISIPSRNASSNTPTSASQDLLRPLPFVEGWRALMSVISRSQWRRAVSSTNPGSSIVSTPVSEAGNPFEIVPQDQEVDEVKEIVKDVKSRHGGVSKW